MFSKKKKVKKVRINRYNDCTLDPGYADFIFFAEKHPRRVYTVKETLTDGAGEDSRYILEGFEGYGYMYAGFFTVI